jgi:hypothetical protein
MRRAAAWPMARIGPKADKRCVVGSSAIVRALLSVFNVCTGVSLSPSSLAILVVPSPHDANASCGYDIRTRLHPRSCPPLLNSSFLILNYFDGAPRHQAIAVSVLVAPHFQHVNHFHSGPIYDCVPQVEHVATKSRVRPSASPSVGGAPLPRPPCPSGFAGPSSFPHVLSCAISISFLAIPLSFRIDDHI